MSTRLHSYVQYTLHENLPATIYAVWRIMYDSELGVPIDFRAGLFTKQSSLAKKLLPQLAPRTESTFSVALTRPSFSFRVDFCQHNMLFPAYVQAYLYRTINRGAKGTDDTKGAANVNSQWSKRKRSRKRYVLVGSQCFQDAQYNNGDSYLYQVYGCIKFGCVFCPSVNN